MKHLKGVGLTVGAAVVAAAVLVPLYGDPRRSPVTHAEWARMLLRALEMDSVLEGGGHASLAFDSLSWRTTVGLDPALPFRKTGVEFLAGPPRQVRALAGGGELGYRLALARRGDYRIRLKLAGELRALVSIELTREGETAPARGTSLAAAPLIETGPLPLTPGVYTLSVALPEAAVLEAIEVVPPCLDAIEPPGGWQATALTLTGDVAVTLLKATDLEHELPPAAASIEIPGTGFQSTSLRSASGASGTDGFAIRAGSEGLDVIVHVDVPDPGLYSFSVFGVAGGGQSWLIDGCLRTVLCPRKESDTPEWMPLITTTLSAGRHSFAVTLAASRLDRLKLERKKATVEDYIGTLGRLGLALGEQAPIPRARAREALDFVRDRRRAELSKCEDIALPQAAIVAGLAIPGAIAAAGASGANPALPGAGAIPIVPLPAPGVPSPAPTPAPGSSPAPPGVVNPVPSPVAPAPSPSPSLGPPPTTLAQPPASPVKE